METIQHDRYLHMATINPISASADLHLENNNNSRPHSLNEDIGVTTFIKEESQSGKEDDVVDIIEDPPLPGNE